MSLNARFPSLFILLAVLIVAVSASKSHHHKCARDEFFYKPKSVCLHYGGPRTHHKAPKGKQCPASGWSWNEKTKCCTPHNPLPPHSTTPQCHKGWEWCGSTYSCVPIPTPSQPNSPSGSASPSASPSPVPGSYKVSAAHHKRTSGLFNRKHSNLIICPAGSHACPIANGAVLTRDYECIDTQNELESCDGCASTGAGQDCTAIEGVWNVGCKRGQCEVLSCNDGYKIDRVNNTCLLA